MAAEKHEHEGTERQDVVADDEVLKVKHTASQAKRLEAQNLQNPSNPLSFSHYRGYFQLKITLYRGDEKTTLYKKKKKSSPLTKSKKCIIVSTSTIQNEWRYSYEI